MEFGDCCYDFDIIDIAERSPLHREQEKELRTSKSWCGPLTQLIGREANFFFSVCLK